ncbi:hypothetical protein ACWFRJ_44060 [Streptomyces sp. NPDC055239]
MWVTEIWSSEAYHTASLFASGAKELIGQTLPLLAGPPERIEVTPVGGAGLRG